MDHDIEVAIVLTEIKRYDLLFKHLFSMTRKKRIPTAYKFYMLDNKSKSIKVTHEQWKNLDINEKIPYIIQNQNIKEVLNKQYENVQNQIHKIKNKKEVSGTSVLEKNVQNDNNLIPMISKRETNYQDYDSYSLESEINESDKGDIVEISCSDDDN